jgi:hypothetical protein
MSSIHVEDIVRFAIPKGDRAVQYNYLPLIISKAKLAKAGEIRANNSEAESEGTRTQADIRTPSREWTYSMTTVSALRFTRREISTRERYWSQVVGLQRRWPELQVCGSMRNEI